MLRAALWGWKGDYRWATRFAARLGSGFGLVLVMLGVFAFLSGNIITGMWWFLIGLFLRGAAGMSYQQLMIRETMHGEKVARFMNAHPVTVKPDVRIRSLVDDYVYQHHFKMYPVVENDRLIGCVSTDQVKTVRRDEWDRRSVADVMNRCTPENTVGPNTNAMDAWMQMSRTGASRLLVEEGGRLVGILSLRDLMRFMSLKFDLDQAPKGMPGRAGRS
jgi:CBS domain-containing protein